MIETIEIDQQILFCVTDLNEVIFMIDSHSVSSRVTLWPTFGLICAQFCDFYLQYIIKDMATIKSKIRNKLLKLTR